jgi:hypothetical protein
MLLPCTMAADDCFCACLCCFCVCWCCFSDVGVKEYLVWLDASGAVESFILREVDDTHLFVAERPNLFTELQEFLDAWHDANSFSAAQQLASAAGSAAAEAAAAVSSGSIAWMPRTSRDSSVGVAGVLYRVLTLAVLTLLSDWSA